MTFLNNISTNTAIFFAAAVGLILLYLFFLYGRNPVLVKLGLRNIPRRPSQSILIVIGLALSTIIIVSALSTGDTLSYSLQRQAVAAYGEIDEILAPPLLSLFISLADTENPDTTATTAETTDATTTTTDETAALSQGQQQLQNLTAGGLTSLLTVLEGGLPGITTARYEQLRAEAADDPLIDRVAASILFPTIIRNTSTGQGEPLGFIFAVDNDYDQSFGLNSIDGRPVEMETLRPGVGNIFAQASNLFGAAGDLAQRAGINLQISDVAMATAAVGAVLTGAAGDGLGTGNLDLANVRIPLDTIDQLGIDTTPLRDEGLTELSLSALGVTTETLESMGVNTTTLNLNALGISSNTLSNTLSSTLSNTLGVSNLTTLGQDILGALNLNTLNSEIDRVLAQFGLQLRQGDVYLNRLGAEQLGAQVGDVLDVYIGPIPIPFRVKAIVEEGGPLGAIFPVVMLRLDEAQQLLFMNGKVNNVLVSNTGDELGGIQHTDAVSAKLRVLAMDETALEQVVAILRRPDVQPVLLADAQELANTFDEEFDGPQVLADLIESITPMGGMMEDARDLPTALAEPGISPRLRAILGGTTFRSVIADLELPADVKAELTAALGALNTFDVIDPLNKATLLTVGNVGGSVFASIFSLFGFFSILAGILLIFLIFVMLATERRSEMGMLRAIGVQRRHLVQMFVVEGMIYDLIAAAIGVLLGLGVTYAMVGFLGDIFNNLADQLSTTGNIFRFEFRAAPASVVIGYCLGVLLTFLVVTFSAWRVSRLNIVSAIRDLPEDAAEVQRSWFNRIWGWGIGIVLAGAGWYIITFGLDVARLGIVLAGVTFLFLGVMLLIERILILTPVRNETVRRIVYTIIGLGLLALWAVPWPQALPQILPQWADAPLLDLGPDQTLVTLALGGPLIILGAILAITFNASALIWFVGFVLGGIGSLTPVLKTAIAYPLSARFRTGMTMLMFAMIISTVVIMAVVISATQTIVVLDAKETAGFEIRADSTLLSFFSPLSNFNGALAEQQANPDYPLLQKIAAASSIAEQEVWAKGTGVAYWSNVNVAGVDSGYWQQAAQVYTFRQRAPGFADDAAVWAALQTRNDVAVITPNALITSDSEDPSPFDGNGGDGPRRRRFDEDGGYYGPFRLQIDEASTDPLPELYLDLSTSMDESTPSQRVQIIAVLDDNTTLAGTRLQLNRAALDPINTTPVQPSRFYVKVAEGADIKAVAQEVERAFIGNGLNVVVLAESFAQGQAFARGILRLFQGFMALGLLVGIAALGVITSRTVVERRQQVGMLRAIGFQSNMVALSFVLEASFIAITGLIIGAVTGIVLGQSIVHTFLTALTPETTFTLPWGQIGLILLGSYLAALLATIVPAYGAARVYPAEALRYE